MEMGLVMVVVGWGLALVTESEVCTADGLLCCCHSINNFYGQGILENMTGRGGRDIQRARNEGGHRCLVFTRARLEQIPIHI